MKKLDYTKKTKNKTINQSELIKQHNNDINDDRRRYSERNGYKLGGIIAISLTTD